MVGLELATSIIYWLQRDPSALPYGEVLSRAQAKVIAGPLTDWPKGEIPAGIVIRGGRHEVIPLLQRIRRASGLISSTPVLLLTGDNLEPELAGERWAKGVDVLIDPPAPASLLRKLDFFAGLQSRSEELCSWWRDESLRESPELAQSKFLDSLIENLPNMVFLKEAKELRFVRFNRAGEELLGFSRGELIGKNDFDFFPEDQARAFVEKDRAVLTGAEVVEIPEEKIQTRLRGERILRTKKIPLFGRAGRPAYLLGISEDITELKRKDQERLELIREQATLEERETANQRMAFLAEASMVLTSSFDYRRGLKSLMDLVVPFFCESCCAYLVKTRGEPELVAARGDALGAPLEVFSRLHADKLSRRRTEEFVAVEKSSLLEPESGVSGMRSLLCVPIQVRGDVLGVLQFATSEGGRAFGTEDLSMAEELGRRAGIAIDNAQLYETAQKAIQARDEFLSIASHELKTPMTSLKLQLQMTRRMVDIRENRVPPADRLSKVLDISSSQVDRLNALVDDLLDVSRIESGKLTYEFEELDLGRLVRETVDQYFEHLRAAGCQVTVQAAGAVWVRGDRFRLEQVVLNLLSNAAKYGGSRPVEVSVTNGAGGARVEMRDYGIGIAPSMVEKVFERFERASPSGHIGGLGLGLYICREIVRAHGGVIHVQSELGRGSRFIVEIPLVAERAAEPGSFTFLAGKNSQSYSPLPGIPGEKPGPSASLH